MADLYALLGVPRDASAEDIKRAYRRKARESHPDAGGDEETFKRITHAYQVLGDAEKRRRYDRFGDDGTPQSRRGAGDPFDVAGGFGSITDVIDAFFGGSFTGAASPRSARPQAGRDVLVPIQVTLEDVATGTRRAVEVDAAVTCESCGGSGSASGVGASTCRSCGGSGSVQRISRTAFGQMATTGPCAACSGTGRTVTDPCAGCGGEGRRSQRRSITVEVPPGVEDRDRLRVGGAGEAGRHGAPSGDLLVEVRVAPHAVYERHGRDLHAEVPITMTQAALGARLEVPTVTGDTATVDVPAGAQPGDVIAVRRKGLPNRSGVAHGDLHLHLRVTVPTDLDTEQREALRAFADLRGEQVTDQERGLFTRLREAFR